MAIDLIAKIKPKNNGTFPLVDAVDVAMPDGKRLNAALEELKEIAENASVEIPTYNLTEMGLPTILFDGTTVSLETDTTELRAAFDSGAVRVVLGMNYLGATFNGVTQIIHPTSLGGVYIYTSAVNVYGTMLFITINVDATGIYAYGSEMTTFISAYIDEALGGDY